MTLVDLLLLHTFFFYLKLFHFSSLFTDILFYFMSILSNFLSYFSQCIYSNVAYVYSYIQYCIHEYEVKIETSYKLGSTQTHLMLNICRSFFPFIRFRIYSMTNKWTFPTWFNFLQINLTRFNNYKKLPSFNIERI